MRLYSTEILEPAANIALITLGQLKMELNIVNDTSQDVYLQSQINAASAQIAAYCRRSFAIQTYRDDFINSSYLNPPWPYYKSAAFLSQRPVLLGTELVVWDENMVPLIQGTDYDITTAGQIRGFNTLGCRLSVTYQAGWLLPGDPAPPSGVTARPLPADLRSAVTQTVLSNRSAGRLSYTEQSPYIRSRTAEGVGTVTYSQQAIGTGGSGGVGGVPMAVQALLAPYVIPVVG